MQSVSQAAPASNKGLWSGRIISAITVLFLLVDSLMKVLKMAPAVEATTQFGYPEGVVVPIGIVQLVCLVVYVIPRTSTLGAILLTGYLGGAIATKVRVSSPLFTDALFPFYVAVFLWGGLCLVDRRVRVLMEPRSS